MTAKAVVVIGPLLSFLFLLGFSLLDLSAAWSPPWRKNHNLVHSSTCTKGPCYDINNETAVHLHFMEMALVQAQEAKDRGEVPIGALVVQRRKDPDRFVVLSQASNLVETTFDASAHAELLALRLAAKKIQNWRLLNTTLYTSLEPCPMCLSAALAFRVSSIVYAAPDLRLGAIETHIRLLDIAQHPYHTIDEIVPGILKNESAKLLKDFFRKRRLQPSSPPLQHSASLRSKFKKLFRR